MTAQRPSRTGVLILSALGVVFGDIGTSPLYALRECFDGVHAIPVTVGNVYGVLSLVFWSLIITVSVKYVLFVMRADNEGEGGILALVALVRGRTGESYRRILVAIGLFGAALLYGDGMITPAISVLSAVEGLSVATHVFEPYIVPITVAILIGLFLVQNRGTGGIGKIFGPIMIAWFLIIAVLGLPPIVKNPGILSALNPLARLRVLRGAPIRIAADAGVGLPGDHRRRGAVRGHGALRRPADPDCVVLARAADAARQLLRPGGAAAGESRNPREPLLSPRSGMGSVPARRAVDDGDGDRVAGDHLRRILDDAAGDPAGLLARVSTSSTRRRTKSGRSTYQKSTGC